MKRNIYVVMLERFLLIMFIAGVGALSSGFEYKMFKVLMAVTSICGGMYIIIPHLEAKKG